MKQLPITRVAICAISMFALLQFWLVPEASAQLQKQMLEGPIGLDKGGKFVELLANRDMQHFRGYASEEIGPGWSIEGKHLVYDGSGGGDIMTKETYGDFELQVEWKVEEGGNSGIMFRVTTGDDAPYVSGPEFQILDDEAHSDGGSELTSAGALYGLYPATGKKVRGAGKWNKSRIIVKGNNITHYLNNKKVVEAEIGSEDWNKRLAESKFKDWEKFAAATNGHICFQDHGDPVRFRNIRIKSMGEMTEVSDPHGNKAEKEKKKRERTRGDRGQASGQSAEGVGGVRGAGGVNKNKIDR